MYIGGTRAINALSPPDQRKPLLSLDKRNILGQTSKNTGVEHFSSASPARLLACVATAPPIPLALLFSS